MQADKIDQAGALSAFEIQREPERERETGNGDRHSSSRRRRSSRSPREESERKSRRYDEDGAGSEGRRSSRRHDDRERDSHRERSDRSHRDDRDRDRGDRRRPSDRGDSHRDSRERDWDRERDSRRNNDRRDNRDSRGGDDRRRRDDRHDDRGGGGGGGNKDREGRDGRGSGVEVFGQGNAARSPTPENTIPISKRKRPRTAWDIKAPGFETFNAMQAKMTGIFNLPGQARPMAGYTSMSQSGPLPEIHLGAAGDLSSMNSGAAYARQARRLYVGNITLEATENNVGTFFNRQMRENGWAIDNDPAGVQGPDPVVSVQVNHEKSYAFVEFRSADEATKAIGFDGIVFQSQVLKIRRPKDYLGNDFSGSTHIPGVVSTNVPDTPNKIFVGGLPSYLNDVQVMELLQTFGELRSFNLVKEGSTNNSKGFAFCEYVDPSATDIACQGLNGMELGDRYLVVQRAAIGANSAKQGGYGGSESNSVNLGKVAPNIIAAATAGEAVPTRVLQLLNMVTPEELVDDGEFEDIVEDVKEECGKYGSILDVKIPRPIVGDNKKMDNKASEAVEDLGKVFVMYETVEETKKAMMSIAGRQFGGRSIICAYAEEEKMV